MKKSSILIIALLSLNIGLKAQEKKSYWDNGNLKHVYNYKDEKLNGEQKDYHRNGELEFVLNYKDGEAVGESRFYNNSGELLKVTTYKNGDWLTSDNKERKLIAFNVVSVEPQKEELLKNVTSNYLSRTDLILKTTKNSDYSYAFGLKEKSFDNKLVKSLTILLLKERKVISEISYNIDFEFKDIFESMSLKGFNIEGLDEAIEIGFGNVESGYGYHSTVFFRKNNGLVKGLLVSSYEEEESDYNRQEIIAPLHHELNEIWVKNSIGHSEHEDDEYTDVNYFTEINKFKFEQGKFISINSEKDNFYYVTALSGLNQRDQPNITSETLGLLKYGTRIKLINKTNHKFKVSDNGKVIEGYWAQIQVNDASGNTYTSYVFDGYLSEELPVNNDVKSTDIIKNGDWEWYFENGELGELGSHQNNEKDGEWKWYFKDGALKATGNYENGKPIGLRKWYYNHGDVYCTGQYNQGRRNGEWKWYSAGNELRTAINFNNDTVIAYTILDKKGEIILKNSDTGETKIIFEESFSYLSVFGLRIEDTDGYQIHLTDAELYISKYKNNKREGESKVYSSTGRLIAINNYKKDKLHGKFQKFNDDETLKSLQSYKNGKMTGIYKGYYDNGHIEYIRKYKEHKRIGKGTDYYIKGQIKNRRQYKNGKQNGKSFSYHENGKLESKGNYLEGKKEGAWYTYFENGNLEKTVIYKKDEIEGDEIRYHENGKLKEIKPYKNGKIHGEWKVYDDEGILKKKTQIKDENFEELHITHYYPNGQISAVGFTNDKSGLYGEWKDYYEDGTIKEINNYRDHEEDGKKLLYYNNGQLKLEGQHVKGDRYGKFIWYKEDGKIKEATEFKRDPQYVIELAKWKYYDNGQLKSVELFESDELVDWKYYYDNGQLKELRQYFKNERAGEWKYYFKSGQLRLLAHYDENKPQGEFKIYHENGQLYKTQIWKYNRKLMEINSCFDAKGYALNIGTLTKGTGTVKEYNASGDLINNLEYLDGSPIKNDKSIDDVWLNSEELNSLAWQAYEIENNKERLSFAIKWIEQSIKLDENYYNTDTYAALLYKIGKYKQALPVANKAISIAKKINRQPNATEDLIKKINQKLNAEKK